MHSFGLAVLGLVVGQFTWRKNSLPRISAVRVEVNDRGKPTGTVAARYADETQWRVFATVESQARAALVDLDGRGRQVVAVGTRPPVGEDCLFAFSADRELLWSMALTDGRQWPDNAPFTIWSCMEVLAANIDGEPGDELLVIASDSQQYPTRISILDPRTRVIRSTFWHYGRIHGMFVSPDFFSEGRHAIVAWASNNKLDGFEEPQPGDERPRTRFDRVNAVMILDPLDMEGIGPPGSERIPDLRPAPIYAYAFLDRSIGLDNLIRPLRPGEGERVSSASDVAVLVGVYPADVPADKQTAPWFFVGVDQPNPGYQHRGSLYVDRHLDFQHGMSPRPSPEIDEFWREHWKVIIRQGRYLTD